MNETQARDKRFTEREREREREREKERERERERGGLVFLSSVSPL